ncbi:MAG: 5-amino-6-(5-phosphoribosylamino)uracil reductase [Candidatus Magasanikbacteria bacterium GW2011_GWA2_56_11]|uniref:Riboflavin biosynthesis protein RibD n=1 Tax=Candidatus Magasanikbacteria bacterium GW2011_GWA2_56_11 TaxID=1619044 RepID=A0A0G1YIJ5_9BACT|nr:MAG: 5-amino-6-(5-phosphoribosylamino)uracil reductase [Candidatus Magasanikbacteria bacterium GW2011_GWA2_56_11]
MVKGGRVVAAGYTQPAGHNHAEVEAIRRAGKRAAGSTLYVTLEPCCHFGQTPPCTDAIVAAGIVRVIAGMKDPYPKVNGGGVKILRQRGIRAEFIPARSRLARQIRLINQPFLKWVATGLPYVVVKAAVSLDGKIATRAGDSKWITGEAARADARLERSQCDAVIVGAGTVAADNPELAAHGPYKQKNLLRVIIDPRLSSDLEKKVFRDEFVFVAATGAAPAARQRTWALSGIRYHTFGKRKVSIAKLLAYLAAMGVRSVYVEGGSGVNGSWYDAALKDRRLIDRIIYYIAPKLIGGQAAVSAISGRGAVSVEAGLALKDPEYTILRPDIKVAGFVNYF